MIALQMYEEGTVVTVYIPAVYADAPLYDLYARGLVFTEAG